MPSRSTNSNGKRSEIRWARARHAAMQRTEEISVSLQAYAARFVDRFRTISP